MVRLSPVGVAVSDAPATLHPRPSGPLLTCVKRAARRRRRVTASVTPRPAPARFRGGRMARIPAPVIDAAGRICLDYGQPGRPSACRVHQIQYRGEAHEHPHLAGRPLRVPFATTAAVAQIEIKFGHVGEPGSLFAQSAEEFARRANAKLGNKAKVVVYGSSQLGGDKELVQKLKLGTVDIALPSTVMSSEAAGQPRPRSSSSAPASSAATRNSSRSSSSAPWTSRCRPPSCPRKPTSSASSRCPTS